MSAQHTALPWSAYWIDDARVCVRGAGGKFIAFVDGSTLATVHQRIADAQFIVRACNAHDDLVAALEALRSFAQDVHLQTEGGDAEARKLLEIADAAIAKARGQA